MKIKVEQLAPKLDVHGQHQYRASVKRWWGWEGIDNFYAVNMENAKTKALALAKQTVDFRPEVTEFDL